MTNFFKSKIPTTFSNSVSILTTIQKKVFLSPLFKSSRFWQINAFLVCLLIVGFYTLKGVLLLDPDFGWHIRSGQVILESGISKTDPFSYTMPSYPFVDHAWLGSVMFAALHPKIGSVGLGFVVAVLSLAAIIFAAKQEDVDISKLLPKSISKILNLTGKQFSFFLYPAFWLTLSTILSFVLTRTQVLTWFFTSVTLAILFNKTYWKRLKYFLPPMFLIWANFHGGFSSGLFMVFVVLGIKSIRLRKIVFTDTLIVLGSVLATFMTPYGGHIWREVWMTITSSMLKYHIEEWKHSFQYFNLSFLVLIAFSISLAYKYKHKYLLEEKVLLVLYLFQAISSRKYIPIFALICLPFITKGFYFLYEESKNYKFGANRFSKFYLVSLSAAFVISLVSMISSSFSLNYTEDKSYPRAAVKYLSENTPEGNIFSDYGWGGYLLWKLPQKKVFIDGRMAIWRWDAPEGELDNAFTNYIEIMSDKASYSDIFNDFGVNTVLLPIVKEDVSILKQLLDKIDDMTRNSDKEFVPLDKRVQNDGWHEVYKDDVSVIYQKPQ